MTDNQRELFEAAVVERMKESGFLEIEIRTECLVRCGEGYQDELINAGWHYWNAAVAANSSCETNLRVMDLEWEHKQAVESCRFEEWNAYTIIGRYIITNARGSFGWILQGSTGMIEAASLEDAMAAVQSDFTVRIRSVVQVPEA